MIGLLKGMSVIEFGYFCEMEIRFFQLASLILRGVQSADKVRQVTMKNVSISSLKIQLFQPVHESQQQYLIIKCHTHFSFENFPPNNENFFLLTSLEQHTKTGWKKFASVCSGRREKFSSKFSNGESPENLIFFLPLFPLAWHAAAAVLGVMVDAQREAEEANTLPNNENSRSCNAFV